MFLYYVVTSPPVLTPFVNFVSAVYQLPNDGPLQLRLDQYVTEPGGFESMDVGLCPTAPWDIGSMSSSSFALNAQGHFSETANVARIAGLSPQSVEAMTGQVGVASRLTSLAERDGR